MNLTTMSLSPESWRRPNQVYELWAQTYPREHAPLQLGVSYESMGQYEKAVAETPRPSVENPDNYVASTNLMVLYTSLNRLNDAKATYQKVLESKLDYPDMHVSLYGVAAAEGDVAEMRRQVDWAMANWESKTSFLPSRLTPKRSMDVLARPGILPPRDRIGPARGKERNRGPVANERGLTRSGVRQLAGGPSRGSGGDGLGLNPGRANIWRPWRWRNLGMRASPENQRRFGSTLPARHADQRVLASHHSRCHRT